MAGPGEVFVDQNNVDGMTKVLIWDFTTSLGALKDGHIRKLRELGVLDFLRTFRHQFVYAAGMASRRGPPGVNKRLSRERVENVLAFLRGEGIEAARLRAFEIEALGESRAGGRPNDDLAEDRAVLLVFTFDDLPPPRTIRLPRPQLPTPREHFEPNLPQPVSRRFAISMQWSARWTALAFQIRQLTFVIWDTSFDVLALYQGGDAGLNLEPPLPGSPIEVSTFGPWHCFETTVGMRVQDFGGQIESENLTIELPGINPVKVVWQRLMLFAPTSFGGRPVIIRNFDSGLTLPPSLPNLVNVGTLRGRIVWFPREVLPMSFIWPARELTGTCLARSVHMRRFSQAVQ